MSIDIIKNLFVFVVLVLAQVLVLNHIHLLGCATPLLYVYFVLRFNRYNPQWATLLWGFALGLCIDIFSNTPGLTASSLTFIALLQPYILNLFISHDNKDDLKPTFKTIGPGKYIGYITICMSIYSIVFFTIETFSFFNWTQWISNIIGSIILSVILIIVVENVKRS